MCLRRLSYCVLVLAGISAAAQPRPIFDPDDFVDPRQHDGPVFISRLVLGAARNFIDDFRPLRDDVAFLHVTNTLYVDRFQFDYKRSEARGEQDPPTFYACPCEGGIIFPTPPPANAAPAPPTPGSKDTVQFAWYRAAGGGAMLRSRVSWSRQIIHTTLAAVATGQTSRLSGDEQSFALDTDTHVRIRGHDIWGSLLFSRTVRSGTIADRNQNDFLYTNRFPGIALRPIILRATLTVGGVTGRGASGLNVVSPAFEAFWHERHSRANLHLVWSPQSTRSGAVGWEAHHEIAVFVNRALYVKLFR